MVIIVNETIHFGWTIGFWCHLEGMGSQVFSSDFKTSIILMGRSEDMLSGET